MTQDLDRALAAFASRLLDASGQPNLVIDSSEGHLLTWTLVNNQSQKLVVTPFGKGNVGPDQYHFLFEFSPGTLTSAPILQGWDVYPVSDGKGAIKSLYIALSGNQPLCPLSIEPGGHNAAVWTYTGAIQEDANSPKVIVSLSTGQNVTLGGNPIPQTPLRLAPLTLVHANTPTLSAPPVAVGFVGRRTVLNDGATDNSFTFALTNMMAADLTLPPQATFTVWFDAAPNDQGHYPWALARIQDLAAAGISLTPPSSDWTIDKQKSLLDQTPPVSPHWQINTTRDVVLGPQVPMLFTFSGLKTNLDPGFTRMYLKFEGLPGFRPGVLSAALEKTPVPYGPTRGQGIYLLAGTPSGNTPPSPNYANGLFVEQLGGGAAAIFNGGKVGIGTGSATPAAKLQIVDADQDPNGGTLILGSGKTDEASLRFGCQPGYAWIQSHAGKPLVINPIQRNVAIGTDKAGSALSVNGAVAIGPNYVQNTTIAANTLAVEGHVGVGTPEPGSALSVAGGVAIGTTYAQKATTIPPNALAVEGAVTIGTTKPSAVLQVGDSAAVPNLFSNLCTVGILQRTTDTVGISVRRAGNAVLQFCTYDQNMKNPLSNYVQMERSTGDILIGNQGTQTRVSASKVTAPGLALTGGLTIAGAKDVNKVLEFGFGVAGKEVSAGKIGYQIWSDGLDIVGAGTTAGDRKVTLYDNIYVPANIWQYVNYYKTYMALWPSGTSKGAWYNFGAQPPSDLRLKRDVQRVPAALDKVRRLSGVTFRWNETGLDRFCRDIETTISAGPRATERENREAWRAEHERRRQQHAATQIGVIAQEVEAVAPEAVTTAEDGYKSVDYQQLIPLLIESIKEQDLAIAAQAARAEQQQLEIDRLKQLVEALVAETAARVTR